jgi:hypothetical protein
MKGGTKSIAIAKVKSDGNKLRNLTEFQSDRDVVLVAVSSVGMALKFASTSIIDKEIALAAVTRQGFALKYVPVELKDKELVTIAVSKDGLALQFVPEELKDKELVTIAVSKLGSALCFVPDGLKDKELVTRAVNEDGNAIQFVPEGLLDQQLILTAVRNYGPSLAYIPPKLQNKEIFLSAINNRGASLGFVPIDLMDDDIVLAAVNQSGTALQFVPENLRTKEVVVAALSNNIHALEFLSTELIQSYDIETQFPQIMHKRLARELNERIATHTEDMEGDRYPYDKYMTQEDQLQLDGEDIVTIYISMHGGIKMSPLPKMPTNTVLGSSVGLCQLTEDVLTRLTMLKELYSTHVPSIANETYNRTYHTRVNAVALLTSNKAALQVVHPDKTSEEIQQMYLTQARQTNFIRSYKTDRIYSVQNDTKNLVMGIYIVNTNNVRLRDAMSGVPPIHVPVPVSRNITQETFDILQSQNLNNVHVATAILDTMIGPGSMGMVDSDGAFKSSEVYTTIPHYDRLTLYAILTFFGRMGIRHVNIVEHSCRVDLTIPKAPDYIHRQLSEKEKERGANITAQLKAHGMGGYTKKSRFIKKSSMSR